MSSLPAHQRADALRAADLVRRKRHRSAPSALISQAMRPAACTASTCNKAAGRMHDGRRFGDRLNHAGLVVGEHERNQRPATARPQRASASAARSTRPSAVDRQYPRSPRRGKRPPARTEGCSIADMSSRSRGRFSRAVSIAGVSASTFASVPPEVKITFAGSRADESRDLPRAPLDQAPRRAAFGMHRGRIADQRSSAAAWRARASRPQRRRRIPVEIERAPPSASLASHCPIRAWPRSRMRIASRIKRQRGLHVTLAFCPWHRARSATQACLPAASPHLRSSENLKWF